MSTPPIPGYKYTFSGGLEGNAPSYVVRRADGEFYAALKAGEFCYVFNSRQMGKSSLKNRTAQQLRAEGIACGVVDLLQVGTYNLTEAGWYQGIIGRLKSSLGIRFQHRVWWNEREDIPPLQRFVEFIETVLLVEISQPIVLFFDEIDNVLRFDFKDDFFALIRAFSEQRTEQPEYKRLTFALLGVATPSDLIQDKSRTPFNIGLAIALDGFQLQEVQPLIPGLVGKVENPETVLSIILEWTGGQPFLVQKLCQLVLNSPDPIVAGDEAAGIEQLVRSRILKNWESQDNPVHLITIRKSLLDGGEQRSGRRLGLCQQIVQQGDIPADESPEQTELRLTGLVVKQQGKLRIYNRIYAEVFNLAWFEQELGKLRPYGNELSAWVASNRQDESRLRRGQALQNALAWAAGKSLSDEDYRFLNASQEVEKRVVEEENRILEDARRKAEAKTKKANRWLVWSSLIAFALVGLALFGFVTAQQKAAIARQDAITFQQKAKTVQKDVIYFQHERDQARQEVIAFQQKAEKAKADRKKAQKLADQATIELNKAKQETQSAQQETARAEHKKLEAQKLSDQAQANLKNAQTKRDQALREADVAREGISLERSGFNWMKQLSSGSFDGFRFAELENFLEIMNLGQKLQDIVKNKQVPLKDYPAVSPMLALQMALDNVQLRERNQFESPESLVSVSYSPDREHLATGGYDGTVHILNKSGRQLASWQSGHGQVFGISFSPKQPLLATTGGDGMVRFWNLSGTPGYSWKAHSGAARGISFSPDGEQLVTGGQDGKVRLWDLSGKRQAEWQAHPPGTVHPWTDFSQGVSVSFDPKGQHLATAGKDQTVRLWNLSGTKQSEFVANSGDSLFDVSFSPDGNRLVTSELNNGVYIRDLSGNPLTHVAGNARTASLSPDGQRLAVVSGGKVRILELEPRVSHPEISWQAYDHGGEERLSFNPDGNRMITWKEGDKVREDGTVKIWDLSQPRHQLAELKNIWVFKFDPQGQRLALGDNKGFVQLWNRSGTQQLVTWKAHQGCVNSLDFSQDGQRLVTSGNDGIIRIWNLSKRMPEELFHWDGGTYAILSPHDQHIATRSFIDPVSVLRVWDVSGKKLAELKVPVLLRSMEFSPDGKLIATAGDDSMATVRLWDWNLRQTRIIPPEQIRIEQATFSPDGQFIATAGIDGTAKLWTLSGQQVAQFDTAGRGPWMRSVAFSLDGKSLATIDDPYSKVRLWQIETLDQLLERGCNWLKEYLAVHPANAPKVCLVDRAV